MNKQDPKDLNPEIFELYDQYAHNQIDRRVFVKRLSSYAIGGLTLSSLMSFVMPDYVNKIQVEAGDSRLSSEYITYNSEKGGGEIKSLISKPKKSKGKLPGIIVVHENRGLNPHIEDVGRRAALEGFISFAPDALSPLGGYPGNDDDGREMQRKRDKQEMLEDFIAAYDYLKTNPDCDGKIGVVGFCFGGWISNMMAVRIPGLSAAVPFYGGQPTEDEVTQIQAPLMLHFAGLDKRVNGGWPDYENALIEKGKKYAAFIYPEVNHGFHNDTTGRYNKEAAELAWNRTIQFFKSALI
jgi:carboxymethylenebutenolidase